MKVERKREEKKRERFASLFCFVCSLSCLFLSLLQHHTYAHNFSYTTARYTALPLPKLARLVACVAVSLEDRRATTTRPTTTTTFQSQKRRFSPRAPTCRSAVTIDAIARLMQERLNPKYLPGRREEKGREEEEKERDRTKKGCVSALPSTILPLQPCSPNEIAGSSAAAPYTATAAGKRESRKEKGKKNGEGGTAASPR